MDDKKYNKILSASFKVVVPVAPRVVVDKFRSILMLIELQVKFINVCCAFVAELCQILANFTQKLNKKFVYEIKNHI